jgi:hypothetical protein
MSSGNCGGNKKNEMRADPDGWNAPPPCAPYLRALNPFYLAGQPDKGAKTV